MKDDSKGLRRYDSPPIKSMKENKLSLDYNVFYYPKKFLEDKLCHLLSVIELNKGDKAVSDALQEEISQYRKAISLLTPIPEGKLNGIAEKWLEEYWCEDWCDPSYYKIIKEWLIKFFKEAYDELKEGG